MARLRNYLLLTLVMSVLLGWAAAVESGRVFDTYAYLFDTETDTGNTITAGTLAAPTLNSATASPSTAPGTITLSWTLPGGDPANQIRIWRKDEPCAGGGSFSVLTTVAETPTTYADTALAADTYCYKIQGVLQNWTSGFSVTKEATIGPAVVLNTLKLNSSNGSTNTLITGTPTGARTVNASANPPFAFVVWNSAAVTVTASANWTLALDFTTTSPNFEGATLVVELVLHASSCGVGAPTLIASGTHAFAADGSMTLTGASITAPLNGVLCLKITNESADSGAAHDARIVTTGGSTLNGPFNP